MIEQRWHGPSSHFDALLRDHMALSGNGDALPRALSDDAAVPAKPVDGALATRFGEVVALLMRSPTYRQMSLADLEWIIVPAILSGQFSIVSARGKDDKALKAPVGLAFWARVSDEVDKKLEAQKKAGLVPFRLQPKDWVSGETIWLLDAIAVPQVRKVFLEKLGEGAFKGKTVKHYRGAAAGNPK